MAQEQSDGHIEPGDYIILGVGSAIVASLIASICVVYLSGAALLSCYEIGMRIRKCNK